MSRRSDGGAARVLEPFAPPVPPTAPAAAWDGVEDDFFRCGEAGRFEPPVYLPMSSVAFPLAGVAFLAALTFLTLFA
jgi:hypothetical protein